MRPIRPFVALTAVALLGACGMESGTTGSASGSATPPVSSSTPSSTSGSTSGSSTTQPDPENPTLPPTAGGKVRLLTVTGSVSDGVENGCLLLTPTPTDNNGPWMLMGKVAGIKAGQQVTVRGYRVENIASTCQQGRPFQVEAVVTS